jgi:hypothetical protein
MSSYNPSPINLPNTNTAHKQNPSPKTKSSATDCNNRKDKTCIHTDRQINTNMGQ